MIFVSSASKPSFLREVILVRYASLAVSSLSLTGSAGAAGSLACLLGGRRRSVQVGANRTKTTRRRDRWRRVSILDSRTKVDLSLTAEDRRTQATKAC
jgi:hypothetical protein